MSTLSLGTSISMRTDEFINLIANEGVELTSSAGHIKISSQQDIDIKTSSIISLSATSAANIEANGIGIFAGNDLLILNSTYNDYYEMNMELIPKNSQFYIREPINPEDKSYYIFSIDKDGFHQQVQGNTVWGPCIVIWYN